MSVPQDVRKAGERLYLGCGSAADEVLVTTYLAPYANAPADPRRKGFWVLSLHAQHVAKARYKSVSAWLAGR